MPRQGRAPPAGGDGSEGELSDSARAVLRIQQELAAEDGSGGGSASRGRRAGRASSPKKTGQRSGGVSREDIGKPIGDGREHGSITGIKLGEFAPGARRAPGAAGFSLKGKDGKDRNYGQSLESLANLDAMEEESRAMPEAPSGSYRRRDVAEAQGATAADEAGRPKSHVGIDGKVWNFVQGPGDDSNSEGSKAKRRRVGEGQGGSAKKAKKEKERGKAKKIKKDSKAKKKKAKKKGKDKKKKKKTHKSSSGSSDSSSDSSSS